MDFVKSDKFRSLIYKPLLLFHLKSLGYEYEISTNNLIPTLNSNYDLETIDETIPPSTSDQEIIRTNIYENAPPKPYFDESWT